MLNVLLIHKVLGFELGGSDSLRGIFWGRLFLQNCYLNGWTSTTNNTKVKLFLQRHLGCDSRCIFVYLKNDFIKDTRKQLNDGSWLANMITFSRIDFLNFLFPFVSLQKHAAASMVRLLSIISHIKKKSKRRTPIFKQNKTSSFTSLTNLRETTKITKTDLDTNIPPG